MIDTLLARAQKEAEKSPLGLVRLKRVSELHKDWKYLDFADLSGGQKRPCLLFEFLFGTRGMMPGRVCKLDAEEATGKSSMLYLLYGMFVANGAFVINYETERSEMPPDRAAHLMRYAPNKVLQYKPGDVEDCLDHIKKELIELRTNLDPECRIPIVVGIDSVSALGGGGGLDADTIEIAENKGGIGSHSRKFSEFFRDNLDFMEAKNVILLATGQLKEKFSKMPGLPGGKTTIAEGTFKFHSSWVARMSRASMPQDKGDGDVITVKITKNKLAPKRTGTLDLYRDSRCWDLTRTTVQLLFSSFSPFKPGTFSGSGGWYKHEEINKGKALHDAEFLNELYGNQDLLMRCREAWQVRGFGFRFEDDFDLMNSYATAPVDEDADAAAETESIGEPQEI